MTDEKKAKPGRPVENQMPERIPDTPERVAKIISQTPPKKEWRYLRNKKSGKI